MNSDYTGNNSPHSSPLLLKQRNMKKAYLLLLMLIPAATYAQHRGEVRLNGYANYIFDDNFDSYYSTSDYYDGTLNGGLQWGVGLEYLVAPNQGVSLTYLRQDTESPTTYFDPYAVTNPVRSKTFDVSINNILLGSTRYFRVSPVFEPYGGIQIGMAIIGVSNSANGTSTSGSKFAWGFNLGSNLWFTDRVGLKLEGNMRSVTQAVGGGLYFDYTGTTGSVVTYSTILQFGLGGGIVVRLR